MVKEKTVQSESSSDDSQAQARQERVSVLFGVEAPDTSVVKVFPKKENTPKTVDPDYYFDSPTLRKVLLWLSAHTDRKNMIITGDGGNGKTSIFLEVAARLGHEVFAISCSGKTRFDDLVGTVVLNTDGSSSFVDGPLVQAMRRGGIFLANELTRMDAGEQMRLVDVLDERATIFIPQTGELIQPHPDFRFAASGNSGGYGDESGAYPGEKRGSSAFSDRFWKIKLPEMPEEEEVKLIAKKAPKLPKDVVEGMVKMAREVRNSFVSKGGPLRVNISTRGLVFWAKLATKYSMFNGFNALEDSFRDAILNGAPEEDAAAIMEVYTKFVK